MKTIAKKLALKKTTLRVLTGELAAVHGGGGYSVIENTRVPTSTRCSVTGDMAASLPAR